MVKSCGWPHEFIFWIVAFLHRTFQSWKTQNLINSLLFLNLNIFTSELSTMFSVIEYKQNHTLKWYLPSYLPNNQQKKKKN